MAVTSGTPDPAGSARTIRATRVRRLAVVAAAAMSLVVAGCDGNVTGPSRGAGGGTSSVSADVHTEADTATSHADSAATGATTGADAGAQTEASEGGSAGGHSHDTVHEVAAGEVPSIRMEAIPDSIGGWNIHLIVDRFRFAPENAGKEVRPGEGHVHLYLDGKKVARVYGEWFHLAADWIAPGEHTLSAMLNANDHGPWAVNGTPISASAQITVPTGDEETGHSR